MQISLQELSSLADQVRMWSVLALQAIQNPEERAQSENDMRLAVSRLDSWSEQLSEVRGGSNQATGRHRWRHSSENLFTAIQVSCKCCYVVLIF